MSLPPVVSNPEGPCPNRQQPSEFWLLPHVWATDTHDFNRCRCEQWGRCLVHCPTCDCPEVCRYCGGRRPEDVDDWPPRDSND